MNHHFWANRNILNDREKLSDKKNGFHSIAWGWNKWSRIFIFGLGEIHLEIYDFSLKLSLTTMQSLPHSQTLHVFLSNSSPHPLFPQGKHATIKEEAIICSPFPNIIIKEKQCFGFMHMHAYFPNYMAESTLPSSLLTALSSFVYILTNRRLS